ncbi:MAG: Stp1/IreP family PP2C-type Ser/Thr phosphatase [Defluviitaleaceae bacterium]|nr:Stp1/IreP family PP2C-type Ser/Thr phosphatase [Defluviitaleaceae bacterium]
MYAAGLTHTGQVRSQNQDAIFVSADAVGPLPNLFVVADGMGGHKAGDVASRQAVERFTKYIREMPKPDKPADDYIGLLLSVAERINGELFGLARANPEEMHGMGTTFIACVIEDGRADFVHVGDGRAYAVTPDRIIQFSDDHTYAEEMFRAGEITAEEARMHPKRHHLTRVLGFDPHVELDGFSRALEEITSILLCTDGLSNMLDDGQMMEIVNREGYVEVRTQALVDEANARGGSDNISAVLIDLRERERP